MPQIEPLDDFAVNHKASGVWICRNRILNKRFPYMTASKNDAMSAITS